MIILEYHGNVLHFYLTTKHLIASINKWGYDKIFQITCCQASDDLQGSSFWGTFQTFNK